MKTLIAYYSTYGHEYRMAEAVAEGVKQIDGAEPVLRRVPETLPGNVLERMDAVDARGRLLVTDPGVSTVTSYDLDDGVVTDAIAFVETVQAATCWIVSAGRYAYAANTGSGSLSGYRVQRDGALSEIGLFSVGDGALNIDLAVTRDGRFVYTQNGGFGTVNVYRVDRGGVLAYVDEIDVVEPRSGFQGIAAW